MGIKVGGMRSWNSCNRFVWIERYRWRLMVHYRTVRIPCIVLNAGLFNSVVSRYKFPTIVCAELLLIVQISSLTLYTALQITPPLNLINGGPVRPNAIRFCLAQDLRTGSLTRPLTS